MIKVAIAAVGAALIVAMAMPRVSDNLPQAPATSPRTSVAATSVEAAGNGVADVTLVRAPDGHFYADASVNGATIHVLVDTGATTVALTRADAQAAGLQFSPGDFTGTAQTAGGDVALKPVKLDRVGIGPVEAHNVDAVVVDSRMSVSLLGQSWLRRVGNVQITGDRMVLR
ncbi:MAG: family clan aspartic protease [Sphingomonadales bacterium]|nr:family clan aspartic protease [Sphingomonadales bacterium]